LVAALGISGAVALLPPSAASAASSSNVGQLAPVPAPAYTTPGELSDHADPGIRATRSTGSTAPLPIGTWRALGPKPIGPPYLMSGGYYGGVNSGRVTAVAQLPASGLHPNRVVAGTAGGGVWTSDDNGTTWHGRSDRAANLAVGALTVDPSNPGHLIAGTGEANQCADCFPGSGILVSNDGGDTWALQNPSGVFSGRHIAQVAIDPSNPSHQFAATDGGLYVTSDGGSTWAKPTSSTYAALDGNVTAVAIDPATPTNVYIAGNLAGGTHTIARSADGGTTWAAHDSGVTAPGSSQMPLIALAISPSSPTTLYAAVGGQTLPMAVYKQTSASTTWTKLIAAPDYAGQAYAYGSGTGEQGWYDNVVAVDPVNANHVIAGGIALVETIDGGTSWTNVNGQNFFGPAENKFHPDQHALAFAPNGTVWNGDDGGVYHYTPSRATVANANGNLNITQFYFGFNAVGYTVLAGSQDNASFRTGSRNVSPWTGIGAGDGGPSAITTNDTQVQFIEGNQNLFVTTDAFASTRHRITPPQLGLFSPPMLTIPFAPTNPIVFYGGPNLYRTMNPTTGASWQQVTTHGTNCQPGGICVSAIAVSGDNQYVYVGFTDGTIEVSTNQGVSFSPLPLANSPEKFVTGISVRPADRRAITVSFSYNRARDRAAFPHVYQYRWTNQPTDGSWTNITGNLPAEAVSRVVYDYGALVAATDNGVYTTGLVNGGSTNWTPVGSGLPNVQVQDLYLNTVGLFAVTHGRGAWYLPGPADLAVTMNGPSTFRKGTTGFYTVNVRNYGPSAENKGPSNTAAVTFTDPVPAGTTFVSEQQRGGPTFNCKNPAPGATGTTTCTIYTMAPGAEARFQFGYALPSSTSLTTVLNTANASSGLNPDPVPANNTARLKSPVSP
jgi:uncharacterized repeat protein (TIGR01451 family)